MELSTRCQFTTKDGQQQKELEQDIGFNYEFYVLEMKNKDKYWFIQFTVVNLYYTAYYLIDW